MDSSTHYPTLAPVCRNVTINGRRTSIRMEPILWDALHDICQREALSLNQMSALVDRRRGEVGLTAAVRVFVIGYFREAARRFADSAGPLADDLLATALDLFGAETAWPALGQSD